MKPKIRIRSATREATPAEMAHMNHMLGLLAQRAAEIAEKRINSGSDESRLTVYNGTRASGCKPNAATSLDRE